MSGDGGRAASDDGELDDNACYVYFMRQAGAATTTSAVQRHRIKIGISSSPEARLANLQTGNPDAIRLVKTTRFASRREARACEASLHRQWAHRRVKREWFELDVQELQQAIDECQRRAAPPSTTTAATVASLLPPSLISSLLPAPVRAVASRVHPYALLAFLAVILVIALLASRTLRRTVCSRVGDWCVTRAMRTVEKTLSG